MKTIKKHTSRLVLLLVWSLNAGAQPVITRQPVNQSVSLGAQPSFSVTAFTNVLSYQWRLNDQVLTSSTNRTLTLTNVTMAVAGNYSAEVGFDPRIMREPGAGWGSQSDRDLSRRPSAGGG